MKKWNIKKKKKSQSDNQKIYIYSTMLLKEQNNASYVQNPIIPLYPRKQNQTMKGKSIKKNTQKDDY